MPLDFRRTVGPLGCQSVSRKCWAAPPGRIAEPAMTLATNLRLETRLDCAIGWNLKPFTFTSNFGYMMSSDYVAQTGWPSPEGDELKGESGFTREPLIDQVGQRSTGQRSLCD